MRVDAEMKKVGRRVSLMMGLAMSFCLSLANSLASGHFALGGFLLSFALSLVISLLIGLLVPMGRVNRAVDQKLGLRPGKLSTRCVEALVSDLIYTPVITVAMVALNYRMATAHGAPLRFGPMLAGSLPLSLAIGFVLAFLLLPVFMKLAMGKGRG